MIADFIANNGGLLALALLAARFIAKEIPDSAGGWVGGIRSIMKFLGAYRPNKQ